MHHEESKPDITHLVYLYVKFISILQLKINQISNLYRALKLSIARRNAIVDLAVAVPVFCLLQSLAVSNNALTNIDPRIGLLPMLKSITIDGNPLKLVSPRVRGMPTMSL